MLTKTRFAPSPTGYLHIGGVRTALFSWLHARKHGGKFVLRIEDTDRARSTVESVDAILEGMTWLGLECDEGPFYQTQRFDRYNEVITQLLKQGDAYRCYCSKQELDALRAKQMASKEKPRYDGRCRVNAKVRAGVAPVIRFKGPPTGESLIKDLVKGSIVVKNSELDDLIIARADGTPTYNFTVVVDDLDMDISLVIRGDDHINNTPRQINIMKALGAKPPLYAHVPMILAADGTRLSKRHGAVSIMQYREEGYLPEALLNYLVRLGWSHGDKEIFSIAEMIQLFEINDVNVSASTFNAEKLMWLNQHYIMTGDRTHISQHLSWHMQNLAINPATGPSLNELVDVQRERHKNLADMAADSRYFYQDFDDYAAKAVRKYFKPEVSDILQRLQDEFTHVGQWNTKQLRQIVLATAETMGLQLGKVAQPLRVAISGKATTPSIDKTLSLLGRQKTLERVARAIKYVQNYRQC